ncbi:hypothetical protein GH733_006581, partial [Mirounga leonina]
MEGQRWLPLEANPEVTNQVSEVSVARDPGALPARLHLYAYWESGIRFSEGPLALLQTGAPPLRPCASHLAPGDAPRCLSPPSGPTAVSSRFLGCRFLKQLGLHPNWQFVDVYGMDPELLSMVPRPVCAVLLLFPITEKYEVFRTEEEEKIKSQGQDVTSSVYFMKQTISNACGTIGLIHAIANNKDKMHFESGSTLKKFLEESVSMSPEERARYLENYDV